MVGVNNVEVVGCQSIYYSASLNAPTAWEHRKGTGRSVSSITGTIDLTKIVDFCIKNNVDMIGQDESVEHEIALGQLPLQSFVGDTGDFKLPRSILQGLNAEEVPLTTYHEYITKHFYKFFDVGNWVSHIAKNYDFAFGTRFHGNVAALQSGVPSLWLTHDIRTIELCKHFGLPNIPAESFDNFKSIEELKDVTDYSAFRARFPKLIDDFLYYLERNGVKQHISDEFLRGIQPWRS
jgi:hypothetical protein